MKKISRRSFLQVSATAAAGVIVAACTPSAPPATPRRPRPPRRRPPLRRPPPLACGHRLHHCTTAAPAPTAGRPAAGKYKEAPMLADLVKAGKLPPVEERLPDEPQAARLLAARVAEARSRPVRRHVAAAWPSAQYDNDGYMMCETPLLNTPGIQGDNITPNVLETFDANADNTVYTCALRKGLKWSDGVPVTTKDVQFVWDDWYDNAELNPGRASGLVAGRHQGDRRADEARHRGRLHLQVLLCHALRRLPGQPRHRRLACVRRTAAAAPLPRAIPQEVRRCGQARCADQGRQVRELGPALQRASGALPGTTCGPRPSTCRSSAPGFSRKPTTSAPSWSATRTTSRSMRPATRCPTSTASSSPPSPTPRCSRSSSSPASRTTAAKWSRCPRSPSTSRTKPRATTT